MTLASAILTSSRYDLKDTDSTQYTDAQLIDYLNRGLKQLTAYLGAVNSDWVKASEDLTLLIATSSLALPTTFSTPRSIWIDTLEIEKVSWESVKYSLRSSPVTAQPSQYALEGSNMIFNTTSDQEYTVECLFNKTIAVLTTASTMPFNSEYDQILIQAITLIAKNIDEYDVAGDAALYDFFSTGLSRKTIARNHNRKYYKLGF